MPNYTLIEVDADKEAEYIEYTSGRVSPVDSILGQIKANSALHAKRIQIAEYDHNNPAEKSLAFRLKASLKNRYGDTPEVSGWSFVVSHSPDHSRDYVTVTYTPSRVTASAADKFAKLKEKKRQEDRAKTAKRRASA